MSRRQHLFIDIAGQALIFLYLVTLVLRANNGAAFLQCALVSTVLNIPWQFANALISSKYYEHPIKRPFVRWTGYSLAGIAALYGMGLVLIWFLWVVLSILSLEDMTWAVTLSMWFGVVAEYIFYYSPIYFLGLSLWYYGLSFQDANDSITKVI